VIVLVPGPTLVTVPPESVMVATDAVLLVHVPPPEISERVDVDPMQIFVLPVIAGGVVDTVTAMEVIQVVGNV
jgi:hypothetical protein